MSSSRVIFRWIVCLMALCLLLPSNLAPVFATESDPSVYATPVAAETESDTPSDASGQHSQSRPNASSTRISLHMAFYTEDAGYFPSLTHFMVRDELGNSVSDQFYSVEAVNGFSTTVILPPGVYVVSVFPGDGQFGRQVRPFSQTITFGPGSTAFTFTLPMEVIPPASTLSVVMQDGGLIPPGLTWAIYPSGSWDAVASGAVTGGVTRFDQTVASLAAGSYQLWLTGNGYSQGQVFEIGTSPASMTVSLIRLQGTLDVRLTTSDGGDVPAGTVFKLTSGSTVVASHTTTTALANGSLLDLGSVEFGNYELSITPPADATGRRVVPITVPVAMTDPWTPDVTADVDLEIFVPMAEISLSVDMSDAGPLPMGLSWTLFPAGSWDAIATGAVTPGGLSFDHTHDSQVPVGVYQLWITGNGYSSGQVINVESETFHHGFTLDRMIGNLAITVTTNDGEDIPSGTAWEIVDADGNVVQSGILDAPLASGEVLPGVDPIEFGMYTLNIGPNAGSRSRMSLADLPRKLLPFSAPLEITNPWITEYAVTANLQWADSDLSFSVTMADNGPLPNGLTWMLVVSGSWDPLASGPVTAGGISFDGLVADPVPYGVYQLWITGNGYSSGQVMNIESPTSHHDFVLDRLIADVTVELDTSDDAEIPAGTTWSLTTSAGEVIESGTLATTLADGAMLPISSPLEFDVYTLVINAEGYHPVTMELALTNPWLSEYAFTANLVSDVLPTPSPSPIPDTPTPTPTPTSTTTPAPATPAPEETVAPMTVTTLPQTGSGNGSSIPLVLMVGATIGLLGMVLAADQRRYHRRDW